MVDKQGARSAGRFLDLSQQYNNEQITKNDLISQTSKLGFVNVIDAFHVVNNEDVPERFFIDERKQNNGIRITEVLYELFSDNHNTSLLEETEAR